MAKKEPLTPTEYYALPTPAKKAHALALIYMARCGSGFSKKSLFSLRHYFAKNHSDLQVLYDFIYAMPENEPVSLYEIYDKARKHQLNLRMNTGKTEEVDAYPSLLSCLGKL